MRRSITRTLILLIVAGSLTITPATITDDVNPMNHLVQVGLQNPDPAVASGEVEVTVDLGGGRIESKLVPFTLPPRSSGMVTAAFGKDVVAVLRVDVIEGGDTI